MALDLTGWRFGRLLVISVESIAKDYDRRWKCICDCGEITTVLGKSLRRGESKSCGCLRREVVPAICRRNGAASKVHGMKETPEYNSYHGAKNRCTNPKAKDYGRYGARGIEFRFKDFIDFFAAVGPKPSPLHSVDRINTYGHYEPGNVRWATPKEQAANRRNYRKDIQGG